jgi:hypothetical protein
MATHHSTTKRPKSTNAQIVVPPWDSVWQSFKEANEKTTVEAMEAKGWKLLVNVAEEIGASRQAIHDLITAGKMEKIKERIQFSGKTREMVFVRPRVTTCQ